VQTVFDSSENRVAWNDIPPDEQPDALGALAGFMMFGGRKIPRTSFAKLEPKPDPIYGTPCARSSHGLSVVDKGRRLVLYGGESKPRTPLDAEERLWFADREEDDEDGNEVWQWRCIIIPSGDPQPSARIAHSQAAIDDRFVFVFGGRSGIAMEEQAMNDLWMLDTKLLQWTEVEAEGAPERRSFHRMVADRNYLYVFGGCGENDRLADLHRFDVRSHEWENLGTSVLRGRGGANLLVLQNHDVAVVAGFAGEETADGQRFDLSKKVWQPALLDNLDGLRPRSVCVTGSFPSLGINIVFGGEVDPSERGHEGAGGFANDLVFFNAKDAQYLQTAAAPLDTAWPLPRGWSDGASYDSGKGKGALFFFGGLTGDDAQPERLDDLWRLDVRR